jgi:uncharacterized membrane protein YphA (DoxX/SURF4 family)
MSNLVNAYNKLHDGLFGRLQALDGLGPLALRLYLVPVFWVAGTNKLSSIDGIAQWFGEGLGLPFPTLMAYLATYTEVIGALLLLVGFAVRWISVPLMITMLVAIFAVHWDNGWQAVVDLKSAFPSSDAGEAIERLDRAKGILREHGNYGWLTEKGGFVVSNNGIEWGVTYFVMCLALFFTGGGRYFSLDYWLGRFSGRA